MREVNTGVLRLVNTGCISRCIQMASCRRRQPMRGTMEKTQSGLSKSDLARNKNGNIVSAILSSGGAYRREHVLRFAIARPMTPVRSPSRKDDVCKTCCGTGFKLRENMPQTERKRSPPENRISDQAHRLLTSLREDRRPLSFWR